MKKPLLLHYYITNRCNARCVFCDIWKSAPKIDADKTDVLSNLREARKAGCKFVDFTGGEPLLHSDLSEFLREAKKLKFITSVTTNCLLFENRAKELAGLIDLLHFSIDADNAELHNKIRGCDSYEHVLRSIDIALANKLRPDLLYTYTADNIDAIDGIQKIAREKKLMLILDPVFSTNGGKDSVSEEVHLRALEFSKKKNVYLNRAHLILRKNGGNNTSAPVCRAVTSTVVITPDNSLALPCFHQKNALVKIDGNLNKILKSDARLNAMRNEGRYDFCDGCHINCYFDPSYQYQFNKYLFASLRCKLRYAVRKYLRV